MSDPTLQSAPALPTGTVTFLFTDVEGSTRLWEQDAPAMRQAMARHDALIEAAVAQYSGSVVRPRGEGDSRFAVFARATDAVNAVAATLRALYAEPWPTAVPLRVRLALHTGEADLREGDYYGTAVNRCARIRAVAHGGQVLISQTTYDLVHERLPDGATLCDMGEHRLKDLQRPEHLFQLVLAGLPEDFPPLASLENYPNNLPASLTSFIGREREMAEVKRLLGSTRLLTITGAGGGGKTRLALQVAADLLDAYADGVWLVELAPLSDPMLVPASIASVLGVREAADRPLESALIGFLRDKNLLIVLDNCEHLVASVAELAEKMLRGASRIRLLVTSREALGAAGEIAWRIPPLSLPSLRQPAVLQQLSQYEAVRLFIDRAAAVKPGFAVTNENAPAVAEICARLDGIPLAVELAAARVKVLAVEEIAARLDGRLRLLVGGSRTARPRQQTLRALIDWSYDLLGEEERVLLRRLSVFVGGFALDAAEVICADESDAASPAVPSAPGPAVPLPRAAVLDLLARLVDKSLVVAEAQSGTERYRMLEMIREYAQERLAASAEQAEFLRRHAEYYAQMAKESFAQLWTPQQRYWLPRLEAEHDNLRAALEWTARDPTRAEMMLRFVGDLWRFWEIHGHLAEGRAWMERALPLATALDPNLTPRQIWHRANVLRGAGNLARQQGDYAHATALHEQSLALFQRNDDRLGIARELDVLGEIARFQGNYARATQLHSESLTIRREIGDREGVASSLNNLGVVAHDTGDNQRATTLLEECLSIYRESGDRLGIALALNNLGLVAHDRGESARAAALYEESMALYRELDDKLGVSYVAHNLGRVAQDRGNLKRAQSLFAESLALKQELGDRRGVARALAALAQVAVYQGEYYRAGELAEQSSSLYRELGVPRGLAHAVSLTAAAAHFRGEAAQASALAEEAARLAQEAGLPRVVAFCRIVLGLEASARGKYAEAIGLFQQALALFRRANDFPNTASTFAHLARAAFRQGDAAAAQRYIDESDKVARQIGDEWVLGLCCEAQARLARRAGDYPRSAELLRESLRRAADQGSKRGLLDGFEAMASLEVIAGQFTRAARLFAAAEKLREETGAAMDDDERLEYEHDVTLVRGQLGQAINAAWQEGCALTLEQAIAEALR